MISCGTTRAQEVVTGTLADIVSRAASLAVPATVVIGDVVRLRKCMEGLLAGAGAAALELAGIEAPGSTYKPPRTARTRRAKPL